MIRTHLILLIECTLLLLVCSCNGQKGERSVKEIEESLTIEVPDTSFYGTLSAITPSQLTFTPEYGDSTTTFYYDEARGRHQIAGSLKEGDRYALVVAPEEQAILQMLNITELSGQWFYNTAESRGLVFTAAGALSSINSRDFAFKKWKFHNGRIILYYVNVGDVVHDARNYLRDTTDIQLLTPDSLVFRFRNSLYRCTRQREAIKFHM